MNEVKSIKLNMTEYQQRKQFGRCTLSQQEKEARLYALAKKLGVKIGGK
ncbi:MAG: hypothetical protein IIY21_04090 [Clostridiales bacterium]|nr:hypothetical protein [Clostridiales bacterium]MBQ1570834.1 hypothetical protein [Clostridiales bacterium]